jgi:hypothetical protein
LHIRLSVFGPEHRRPEFVMLAAGLEKNYQNFMSIPTARPSRMTKTGRPFL